MLLLNKVRTPVVNLLSNLMSSINDAFYIGRDNQDAVVITTPVPIKCRKMENDIPTKTTKSTWITYKLEL